MKLWVVLASIAGLVVSGCSTPTLVGRPDLQIVNGAALPPPGRGDLILQQRSYLVGPFDRVAVDVYGVPELTRTIQVDASGHIQLPLVGDIEAAGSTTAQLAELIKDRLRGRFVRDPQVIVNADTVNQMITVDGEVKEPGLYPVTGRMTLMRAIARAKGVAEFGNTHFVVVFRRVNNQDMAALYDLRAIRLGMYEDPEVFSNDVVFVGESQARRLFQNFIQASGLLVAPLIALIQR
jgi:polysaccharide export outer membrane protein